MVLDLNFHLTFTYKVFYLIELLNIYNNKKEIEEAIEQKVRSEVEVDLGEAGSDYDQNSLYDSLNY